MRFDLSIVRRRRTIVKRVFNRFMNKLLRSKWDLWVNNGNFIRYSKLLGKENLKRVSVTETYENVVGLENRYGNATVEGTSLVVKVKAIT